MAGSDKVDKKDNKDTKDTKDSKEIIKPEVKVIKTKTVYEELQANIILIEKGVEKKDASLIGRVIRSSNVLKKKLDKEQLYNISKFYYNDTNEFNEINKTLQLLPSSNKMEISTSSSEIETKVEERDSKIILAEVDIYLKLLIFHQLYDKLANKEIANEFVSNLLNSVQLLNRRTCDLLVSRVYFYYGLTQERSGNLVSIRNRMLDAYRTSCLHHDEPTQAVLTNIILRSYLSQNLYVQADKFRLNSKFPEYASNYQYARYHYYIGLINAIQLDYTSALENLKQSIRKAPSRAAVGFRLAATKLEIIVQMLMGEIPERSVFSMPDTRKNLAPYLSLALAVRVGDLSMFSDVTTKFGDVFIRDKTYSLITRLRNNVIKTGLVKISVCYSRISLADICKKLSLESEEDAESVVAKAIADGIIDASIDHAKKFLYSKEVSDVYTSTDPQSAFHKRTKFCLDLHNESIKALRYPQFMKKDTAETEEERADREALEADMLQQLEEEGDEDM